MLRHFRFICSYFTEGEPTHCNGQPMLLAEISETERKKVKSLIYICSHIYYFREEEEEEEEEISIGEGL